MNSGDMRASTPPTQPRNVNHADGRDCLDGIQSVDDMIAALQSFIDPDPSIVAAAGLMTHASVPMALMIGRAGILLPNAKTNELFGEMAGGSIVGRSVLDVLPDSAPFYSAVLETVFSGRPCSFERQPIKLKKHGKLATGWFDLQFMPVIDTDGAVVAVLGIALEVTQYVKRERSLTEAEQRLRLGLEGSGLVGIWNLDVTTNLSTCDANVARMFGLPMSACEFGVDDSLFIDAIHPDDRGRVSETLRMAIATRMPYRCRYRVKSSDEGARWVTTSGKPTFDESGKLQRLLGVVIDITDQMETASALAESRFQFQTLTETLPQIVWSCDAEGRHDYFSIRWSEFTGISPEAITEETWKQLVHPEDWPSVSRVWHESMREGKPYDIDYRFRFHTGDYRWLRVMALPMRDNAGHILRWFGTSTDIHDAYLLSQERERLSQELERIATEDHLTGVMTRRAFMSRAEALIGDHKASGQTVSLLMLDIDHFKSINDTYGHPAGDKVLALTAQRIKACLKEQDLVGRLGGEEFAVVLPECPSNDAQRVAERIRRAVETDPASLDGDAQIAMTLSIGITTTQLPGGSLDCMLHQADTALYQAKSGGRNRSVVFLDTGVEHGPT